MNKIIFRFSFLVMALIIGLSAISQDKIIKSANSDFKNLQYQSAIKGYTKAWNKMKKNTTQKRRIAFKLGECYRLTNKPSDAIFWYSKVADKKLAWKNPGIFLHYADALRRVGNCEQAIVYYQKHLEKYPDDYLAKVGLLSCENFSDATNKSRFIIYNENVINSTEDDYSVTFSAKKFNQLFFSSNRKGSVGKDRENWTGAWFSDIYQSNYKNSSWGMPVSVDETEVLNTEANEGTPVFNKKFNTVYFTRCEKSNDKKIFCVIMQSNRKGQRWTKPKTVLADASANTGQPWIRNDELVIYFSSDREGGSGGKDIWMASRQRRGKKFDEPINLGSVVNTVGDEMFPYLMGDSILYFSSNGHPGYGGLDIFKSTLADTIWEVPQNVLFPINSDDDDFAIIFKDEKEGYLSSNRQGGLGGDDIYHFVTKKIFFSLEGIVKNERTLFTLPDVQISLLSSDGVTETHLTNNQGQYSFDSTFLIEDNIYNLIFSKENFFSVSNEINTFDYYDNHTFIYNTLLKPIPEDPILLPDILFDLGKWNLKPQYQDSLLVLVKIINDNPNLIIELRSHTDSRSSIEFNDELSQKRAQSVVDYLVSKGIDPGQLIAKGYGERVPRKLTRDFMVEGAVFEKDAVLTNQFIDNLPTNKIQESAHELNRRTEFMIIAKDYKPSSLPASDITEIEIINDSSGMAITYNLSQEDYPLIDCYINNYKSEAILDHENTASFIGEQKVIDLMKQGALSKEDFEGNVDEILKDNKVKEGAIVVIEKLRLGDRSVVNIRLAVRNSTGSLISLGNDILNEFGSYKIDDIKKQIIFK